MGEGHKTTIWSRFECVGGPFDGLTVTIWRRVRTIIIKDIRGRIARYLDDTCTQGLLVGSKETIGRESLAFCSNKIWYVGPVTFEQYRSAKKLARSQVDEPEPE